MDTLAPTILHAPDMLTPGKFAVGQSVSRREDPVLLRGEGNYTADKNLLCTVD